MKRFKSQCQVSNFIYCIVIYVVHLRPQFGGKQSLDTPNFITSATTSSVAQHKTVLITWRQGAG